jgi:hypothetical protein
MEGNSGESGSDYFDCVTDRSGSSSEELEYPNKEASVRGDFSGKSEVQKLPAVRGFRRIDNNRRQTENAKTVETEVKRTQTDDGFEIRGYEVQAPPPRNTTQALKRLSMDATVVSRKGGTKSQSARSKVREEVRKALFGPADAKTPDEEKYELVEQEEVTRGVRRGTGILFRFSMWATIGFVTWVLGGRRAKVGCSELFPNIRERDPVPKVIVRK